MSDAAGGLEGASTHAVDDVAVGPALVSTAATSRPDGVPLEQKPPTPVVDLRLLEYVSDFDRNLVCPICRCPFIDPIRLNCDHTYCKLCLSRTLYNQTNERKTCPTCRKPANTTDSLPIPRFLLHMIDDLVVKCPKSGSGCNKLLKRSDVQTHADFYCPNTDMPCPAKDCDQKTPRKYLTEKCLHTSVECEYCQLHMAELDLLDHLQRLCTVKTTLCSFCNEPIPQLRWSNHTQNCPEATISCPASSIGCTFTAKMKDMENHKGSCVLAALLPSMASMGRRIDEQETALSSLRKKNAILEESFAALQSLVAESTTASGAYVMNLPSQLATGPQSSDSAQPSDPPPFDSATHHMLSLHESLREELDRVSAAISEVDGRASMTIINETLRIREELTHTNAVISSMRMQLQWLTSARLQAQPRGPAGASAVSAMSSRATLPSSSDGAPSQPTRRLSDSARQDTKL